MTTTAFIRRIGVLAIYLLILHGCKPNLEAPTPGTGGADFTKYVAIGNSLTSGFTNNGLYRAGQNYAYPLTISKQMQAAGGGPFNMPFFPEGSPGSGYLTFTGFDASFSPITPLVSPDITQVDPNVLTGTPLNFVDVPNGLALNNLGVPGIRISDLTDINYGVASNSHSFNVFFERMLPDATPLTYTQYVLQTKPTFFTCWLGNNDVLGFAAAGATGAPITNQAEIEAKLGSLIDSLVAGGAKGLLANIPNVVDAPLFTTIAFNAKSITMPDSISALNTYYQDYNRKIDSLNAIDTGSRAHITWVAGQNPPIIVDAATVPAKQSLSAVGNIRQLRQGELILLTGAGSYGGRRGSYTPLDDQYTLTASELDFISQRTMAINNFIKVLATTKGLAFFDAQQYLSDLKAGRINEQGIAIGAGFITGGAFSLDGVHPTPRGYALIANAMINKINNQYGSSLSGVNIADFPGVLFPQ